MANNIFKSRPDLTATQHSSNRLPYITGYMLPFAYKPMLQNLVLLAFLIKTLAPRVQSINRIQTAEDIDFTSDLTESSLACTGQQVFSPKEMRVANGNPPYPNRDTTILGWKDDIFITGNETNSF